MEDKSSNSIKSSRGGILSKHGGSTGIPQKDKSSAASSKATEAAGQSKQQDTAKAAPTRPLPRVAPTRAVTKNVGVVNKAPAPSIRPTIRAVTNIIDSKAQTTTAEPAPSNEVDSKTSDASSASLPVADVDSSASGSGGKDEFGTAPTTPLPKKTVSVAPEEPVLQYYIDASTSPSMDSHSEKSRESEEYDYLFLDAPASSPEIDPSLVLDKGSSSKQIMGDENAVPAPIDKDGLGNELEVRRNVVDSKCTEDLSSEQSKEGHRNMLQVPLQGHEDTVNVVGPALSSGIPQLDSRVYVRDSLIEPAKKEPAIKEAQSTAQAKTIEEEKRRPQPPQGRRYSTAPRGRGGNDVGETMQKEKVVQRRIQDGVEIKDTSKAPLRRLSTGPKPIRKYVRPIDEEDFNVQVSEESGGSEISSIGVAFGVYPTQSARSRGKSIRTTPRAGRARTKSVPPKSRLKSAIESRRKSMYSTEKSVPKTLSENIPRVMRRESSLEISSEDPDRSLDFSTRSETQLDDVAEECTEEFNDENYGAGAVSRTRNAKPSNSVSGPQRELPRVRIPGRKMSRGVNRRRSSSFEPDFQETWEFTGASLEDDVSSSAMNADNYPLFGACRRRHVQESRSSPPARNHLAREYDRRTQGASPTSSVEGWHEERSSARVSPAQFRSFKKIQEDRDQDERLLRGHASSQSPPRSASAATACAHSTMNANASSVPPHDTCCQSLHQQPLGAAPCPLLQSRTIGTSPSSVCHCFNCLTRMQQELSLSPTHECVRFDDLIWNEERVRREERLRQEERSLREDAVRQDERMVQQQARAVQEGRLQEFQQFMRR